MADIPFRILLDVTELKNPNYKLIWISISPRDIGTIKDLRKYVMQKTGIVIGSAKLYLGEGLLLENECITVLREDDIVRVVLDRSYASEDESLESKEKARKCSKRALSEPTNSEEISSTKNKRCQTDDEISYENGIASKEHATTEIINKSIEHIGSKSKKRFKKDISSEGDINSSFNREQSLISTLENLPGAISSVNCSTPFHQTQKTLNPADIEQFFDAECADCNLSSVFLNRGDSLYSFKCNIHALSQASNTSQINNVNSSSDRSMSSTKVNASNISQEPSYYNTTTESNVNLKTGDQKKKRKRHRKRKKLSSPNVENAEPVVPESYESDMCVNGVEARGIKRKHIIFSSPQSSVHASKNSEINEFSDNDYQNSYAPFNTELSNQNINSDIASTSSKFKTVTSSNWDVSMTQNENLNYTKKNECHKSYSVKFENEEVVPKETESTKHQGRNYEILMPLKCHPKVGAHIAYKVLELDELYSPRVSEYREGIVKRIDPSNDEIEIELLKHMIKPGRIGKFENLKVDDNPPPPEIKKQDILSWNALIEPKHISSSS